jgi:hypothetical protein
LPAWFARTVHIPSPVSETVDPETVHTPALDGAAAYVTVSPELAVAATVYVPPTAAPLGGVDVKLIDWTLFDGASAPIEKDWSTRGAGWYLLSPLCVALIVQVPTPTRCTLAPVTVQTPALSLSRPNSTGRPDDAFALTW